MLSSQIKALKLRKEGSLKIVSLGELLSDPGNQGSLLGAFGLISENIRKDSNRRSRMVSWGLREKSPGQASCKSQQLPGGGE